jgi:hypothetical protein
VLLVRVLLDVTKSYRSNSRYEYPKVTAVTCFERASRYQIRTGTAHVLVDVIFGLFLGGALE